MPTEKFVNYIQSLARASKKLWFLSIALFVFAGIASAQLYTGSITGNVTDPSGALVPNAKVSVVDAEKGYTFSATTGSDGRYVVRQLAPGKYSVSVEVAGFQGQKKENITVSVNDNIGVDFAMKVGAAAEVVDVQATGVELQTQDAVTGQVIDRKLINDLPLVGRGVLDLAYLTPGITEVDTDCQGCMANNFTSNGSRNATADILLDGVSSTNFEQNSGILAPTYVPSVDAVEEFKVQQSNFSAEFGFTGSTVVNVVTRSGTNKLHGSLYEFLRNEKLDANDWFNDLNGDPRAPLRRNDFGGTVGGPIVKNKTFFFFDYEGVRERNFASAHAGVPTDLERGGDFGEVCTSNGGTFDGAGNCSDVTHQLWDPFSGSPDSDLGSVRSKIIPFNNLALYASPGNPVLNGTPFQVANPGTAGNLIDPVAAKLIQMFPEPNTDGDLSNNWFASGTNQFSQNQFDIKIDHRFSESKQLSAKYAENRTNSHNFNCFGNEADPCTTGPQPSKAHLFSINYLQTFSPSLVMNLSYGFTRGSVNNVGISGDFPNLNPATDLGLPSYILNSGYKQFPEIDINGYTTAGPANIGTQSFSIIKEGQETHTALGSLDWIRGKHDLKFGAEMRVHRINFAQPGWPGGQFAFDFSGTSGNAVKPDDLVHGGGDGMASFLTGIGFGAGGVYEVPNNVATQNFQFGGFVQDNFHASPKLTVNLGLRYEVSRPRTERFDRMNWLDPNLSYSLTATGLPDLAVKGGEVFANSKDRYNYDTYYGAWQPRFGFAYELPHGAVLRGGYGIYFSQPRSGAAGTGPWGYQGFDEQTPWQSTFQGAGVLPGARLSDPYPAIGGNPAGPKFPPGTSCGQPNCPQNLGPLNDVGFGATGPIPSVSLKIPYEQAWSLGVQKSLPWKIIAEANYVGKKGTHLYLGGFRDLNHLGPDFEKARLSGAITTDDIKHMALDQNPNPLQPYITDPQSSLSGDTVHPFQDPTSQFHIPFAQFTSFAGDSPPIADSIYHSAQFRLEKGFANGLEFLLTYTVSKSIDDASATDESISWLGGGFQGDTLKVQNPNNIRGERALSTFDIPQVLQFSYTYALPVGRGKKFGGHMNSVINGIVGGWQLNGIWRFQAGRPILMVEDGSHKNEIPTYNQRPTLNAPLKVNHGSHISMIGNYFVNACEYDSFCLDGSHGGQPDSALSGTDDYTLGNAPRTYGGARQPGAKLVNMALFKEFPLSNVREGMRMEFRLEAFNALNHPNFGPADTSLGDGAFGTINGLAQGMREVQLGLKLYF
ncbi:MAG TPA: carboxypeptidase regulatory-like domain-containing protein [Terriglobales bacterium]|nr:carboxypeptidase regulatory-like domain-containing protein [Terriglobales bacterium]